MPKNSWIEFLRRYSNDTGANYHEAMRDRNVKAIYRKERAQNPGVSGKKTRKNRRKGTSGTARDHEERVFALIRRRPDAFFNQDIALGRSEICHPGSRQSTRSPRILGRGGQGFVVEGETKNCHDGAKGVAIKVASRPAERVKLLHQYRMTKGFGEGRGTTRLLLAMGLYMINASDNKDAVPEGDDVVLLVMPLKGYSLLEWRRKQPDELFHNGGEMTDLTLEIAHNMLRCIRQLHRKGVAHNNISLGNFLADPPASEGCLLRDIVLADFDRASRFSAENSRERLLKNDLESFAVVLMALTYGGGVIDWSMDAKDDVGFQQKRAEFLERMRVRGDVDPRIWYFAREAGTVSGDEKCGYKSLLSFFESTGKERFVERTRESRKLLSLENTPVQTHRSLLTTPLWEMEFNTKEMGVILTSKSDDLLRDVVFPGLTPPILNALAYADISKFNGIDVMFFRSNKDRGEFLNNVFDLFKEDQVQDQN